MTATFVGALVSTDRVWYCRLGGGEVYLLSAGEARALLGSDVVGAAVAPVMSWEPSRPSLSRVSPRPCWAM